MDKALHPRDDIDIQDVSRKEGGIGLASIQDSIDASIRGLENHIKKSKERLITAASCSTDNIRTDRITITKKQKWKEKMDISSDKPTNS